MNFRSLSVRSKLVITIVVPVAALLLLAALAARGTANIEEGVQNIYHDRVVPLQQLKTIADNYAVLVIDAVNKADAGRMTAEEALADVREAREEIAEIWDAYLATTLTPREQELADGARSLFRAANQDLDRLEAALNGMSGNVQGELDAFNGPLYDSIDPISDQITELVDLQIEVAGAEAERVSEFYGQVLVRTGGLMLLVLIGVVITGVWTYRSVALPIAHMRETLEGIAGNHDLSRRVNIGADDEIGATATALNGMLDQFQDSIRELRTLTDQMASAAEQLSAVSTQTNGNIDQQRSQTEQVSTAMNEMAATVQEVARNASDAASSSQEADQESRAGGEVVRTVVSDIGRLSGEVATIEESVRNLDEKGQQIGSVLDVIRGIAEQTNLLALNAAIEAARAGEQGRGFAVVADEVRTLASRTQDSTADIQAMIESLQAGTRNAVTAMGRGREMAEATSNDAERAGEALESIVQAVGRISDMTTQIASAAEEQNAVAEEINRNIYAINDITGDTANGARQTATASQEVADIASRVRDLASAYRIG
ncbi:MULTISPECIES: methyl-accepting chemotaxis protein [unclassified Thioalkalivibrio]|uniref:methyl-accepting chemotaxis protein n=1 Tax=unclassified Thioalkalivibrio TaxID=2621013 RepID=UPI000373E524|nr:MULTISPECIES: methyl-accepting chemotaxis protein [unclassified Thioalkalivibrio]